jgi:hypothetical protein
MKNLVNLVLISILSFGVFSCSSASPEKAAADARSEAADARVDATNANARATAADAHVKAADARVKAADAGVVAADARVVAADADARVKAAANPTAKETFNPSKARVVIPSGTVLEVSLIDPVNSDTSSPGDRFMASLAESVVINGATLLEKGTKVRGRVIDADGSGRVKGRAAIRLALTDIMQGEKAVAIRTETFAATADSTQTRDAEVIAGGAGVGAAIGAIAGGKKGAAIGAATGGSAGTGVVLATKGKEIHYGPETRLNFTLSNSVKL